MDPLITTATSRDQHDHAAPGGGATEDAKRMMKPDLARDAG